MPKLVNPVALVKPSGYAHGYETNGGRTIYLAGQVSFNNKGEVIHLCDIVRQFGQALSNLSEVMKEAGGAMTDIVKLNLFVKDKEDYKLHMKEIGAVYREHFGKHYPAMTLVEVLSLFEDEALLEIEGIAVIEA
jgi:enamine deaminase RidA (YjgF/YER057c/UK114 family)